MRPREDDAVVVIGAGPAGLTAAYELGKRDVPVTVLEATDAVGGISRTVERDGWRFDIGGHRFFTKVPRVRELWREILPPEDFLSRPRLSRIMYRGALRLPAAAAAGAAAARPGRGDALHPVVPVGPDAPAAGPVALRGLGGGPVRPPAVPIFFKTYTEKVWGIPATEIQADWAAQRIKNLNLRNAVLVGDEAEGRAPPSPR